MVTFDLGHVNDAKTAIGRWVFDPELEFSIQDAHRLIFAIDKVVHGV